MKECRWKRLLLVILAGMLTFGGCAGKDSTDTIAGGSSVTAEESAVQTVTAAAESFAETAAAGTDQVSEDGLRYEYRSKNLVMSVYCDEWDKLDKSKNGYQNATEFLQEAAGYFNEIAGLTGKSEEYSEYKNVNITFLFVDSVSFTAVLSAAGDEFEAEIHLNAGYFKYGAAPVAHELTHAICPSGPSRSLEEGLPSYMQDVVAGKPAPHNYGLNVDILCATLLFAPDADEKISEVFKLTGEVRSSFDDPVYRNAAYNFAGSFAHYIIEKYGMDSYMALYSAVNPSEIYRKVTGKTLEELHEDWKSHLRKYEGAMSAEEIDEAISELFQ